jgi:hypothetical protein
VIHRTRSRPGAPGKHRRRSVALLAALLALLAIAPLVGCTRVRTALAVQGDDTVAGDIVIARAGGPAPVIDVPASLADRVTSKPYRADGYQGVTLRFSDLRFDEINSLVSVAPDAAGRFRFGLRRAGSLVVLGGQVDLTAVPVDQADVQLKVAFPGTVVNSDGQLDGSGLSWVFSPGQVTEFNAVVSTPDPAAPSITRWLLLVGLVVLAAAAGVAWLAWSQRNPPSRWSAQRDPKKAHSTRPEEKTR